MKERILFIFLLFSISAFSQEKASMGTIKLTAIVPDSLLNMKVLHYAQELKYVDKDAQQDTYDAASFFIINWHYKIFCVNRNTGFRKESRIFYFIHLQNEEDYERKESSSA